MSPRASPQSQSSTSPAFTPVNNPSVDYVSAMLSALTISDCMTLSLGDVAGATRVRGLPRQGSRTVNSQRAAALLAQ
jgi:hypothetical protein